MQSKTETTNSEFLRGYLICLANITEGGRNVEACAREAFKAVGSPDANTVRKLGLGEFDTKAVNAIRRDCRHG